MRLRRVLGAVIALGAVVSFVAVVPRAEAATTVRLEGNDRFATAAKISNHFFNPGVPYVYVATGESFPDALAAAPAAKARSAPVLLVRRFEIPAATATELDRLDPEDIVVVGGVNAVSEDVLNQLRAYTEGSVSRHSGSDRYATAAALVTIAFPNPVPIVYIATGQAFPDALPGGAAAGAGGGPLLLVRRDEVPEAVLSRLTNLAPSTIVVLGGPNAISEQVKAQFSAFAPTVVRREGADRYATSVSISANAFPTATQVFLATGENFPDALAAGAAAGKVPGPVLLVRPGCIPPAVKAEITRLNPAQIVVLGGPSAVSNEAGNGKVCA